MDKSSATGADAPPRRTAPSWAVPALVVALAVFTAGALLYGLLAVDRIGRTAAAQLEAAAAVWSNVTATHLGTEESAAGGDAPTAEIWAHLDEAGRNLEALLEGGHASGVEVPALEKAALRDEVAGARALLAEMRAVTEARLLSPQGDAGSALDRRHDAVVARLAARIDRIQRALSDRLREELAAFRTAQGLLGIGAVALAGIAGGVAFGLERRRQRVLRNLERESVARTAAQTENRLLGMAVAQASEIIFITDREARIEYVNDAFVARLGWEPEDVAGRYAEVLRSRHHEGAFYEDIYAGLRKGLPWKGLLHLRRKDGSSLEVEQEIIPMQAPGKPVSNYVVVARDVSRERDLEAQMEHVQRLESLGVLAGGIAHDLNNILTAVMGHAALAREHAGPEAADELDGIESAAQRASELCAQMLAYAGKGRVALRPVSLTQLVEEMPRLLGVSIVSGASLSFDLDPALPPVEADAARIRQVLMNLVINASEAIGPHPGEITVRTRTMHVGPEELAHARIGADLPAGRYVCLEVTDTGCGMDAATVRRIFEPFFTTKSTGRGLGMSAALGIVRSHGGALFIESHPGRGSRFRLLLPPAAAEAAAIPPAPPEDAPEWRGSGTVLVVDDEVSVRHVTRRMLEHLGFSVAEAANGTEALDRLRERPDGYVCVMLDLTMPGLDGAETFRALRRVRDDLPVLLFSGQGGADALAHLERVPRTGFIPKPFNTAQLARTLRRMLEGDRGPQ